MAIAQELGQLQNDLWPYQKKSQLSLTCLINQYGSTRICCLILGNQGEIKKMWHGQSPAVHT